MSVPAHASVKFHVYANFPELAGFSTQRALVDALMFARITKFLIKIPASATAMKLQEVVLKTKFGMTIAVNANVKIDFVLRD